MPTVRLAIYLANVICVGAMVRFLCKPQLFIRRWVYWVVLVLNVWGALNGLLR